MVTKSIIPLIYQRSVLRKNMEYLIEVGLFAAKSAILVASLIIIMAVIALLIARKQQDRKEHLEVIHLNEKLRDYANLLKMIIFDKQQWKEEQKRQKKTLKSKELKQTKSNQGKVFVLKFHGDIKASAVDQLRQEISVILQVIKPNDEVMVQLESQGGMVHGYGLAAAQLLRLRNKSIPLTVCVDKVAASGGYLMACTANQIMASPFAILGSIGVVAQVPNFNRLLKKHDVDYEEITSGEYKRTISMLGEITAKGKQKFTEQIEDTHRLFKDFVSRYRPQLQMDHIATGEHWYGEQSLTLGLIDKIQTSDDWLIEKISDHEIYFIELTEKKSLSDKLSHLIHIFFTQSKEAIINNLNKFTC